MSKGGIFLCAGRGEEFGFAQSIGVGLVESGMGLMRLCLEKKPKMLIFIGSAGSYSQAFSPLEIYASLEARQIESSLLENKSYTPLHDQIAGICGMRRENIKASIDSENVSQETLQKVERFFSAGLAERIARLRFVKVNSSNFITQDIRTALAFEQRGLHLENMEFFSVLRVANELEIPALGIFCVSNHCNENAHRDFIKNHAEVKKALEKVVLEN